MVEPKDEKQRIALELARTRVELGEQSLLVRRSLDLNQKLANSVDRHSWAWMSAAALFGWILSRLPARKKKVYIQSTSPQKEKRVGSGLLKVVWNGIWSIAKPVLIAYLTKKVAQKAKIPGSKWL
ncbi:MAG TPA: hypothetical protein VGY91_06175 [Chthoniobacterales bacterium]|jgi:hypothetical protein|nr:hypothetical protein [Chthoniobacterales bacterium]